MTDAWSITDGYWDVEGEWHPTPPATQRGAARSDGRRRPRPSRRPARPMWFVRAGDGPAPAGARATWCSRTARSCTTCSHLPPDLPLGYHELRPLDGGAHHLARRVAGPRARCPSGPGAGPCSSTPPAREPSWGIGDLADLRELAGLVGWPWRRRSP